METTLPSHVKRFIYQPFTDSSRQIRLVILEPALSDEDDITCRLEVGETLGALYQSLSYVWGDPVPHSRTISLNDQPFSVTTSLYNALRNLRMITDDPTQSKAFWIDAICIDQKNDGERSEQVQKMASIYQAANRVVIWLGDYSEAEDDNFQFDLRTWGFDSLASGNFETTREAFKLAEDLHLEYINGFNFETSRITQANLDVKIWGYLTLLFRRSWFRRLWVIQELIMAKNALVVCGRMKIWWAALSGAASAIGRYTGTAGDLPVERYPFIYRMGHDYVKYAGLVGISRRDLISIIHATRYSRVTDPRDRLFAIRGLVERPEEADFDVDYSKECHVIFRDWARSYIERTRKLQVLNACLGNQSRDENLPSWVPDLRMWHYIDPDIFSRSFRVYQRDRDNSIPYAASGALLCPEMPVDETSTFLSLSGLKVGKIAKIISYEYIHYYTVLDATFTLTDLLVACEEQISAHLGTPLEHGTSLYKAFLDVLFKGSITYGGRKLNDTLQNCYSVWRNHVPPPAYFELGFSDELRKQAYLGQFEDTLGKMIQDGEIFITETGQLGGLGKFGAAKVGDDVFVLLGGNTPFVLRSREGESQGNSKDYQLQSSCYLHGAMDGQAIAAWRTGDLGLETIRLL
ncbi:heterokaryon incompatibility protein-domain-containing protein [Leptodontidium sp. 2 PMI_412]|nr:heterokaryon incompatibility protein-domain-containing protein [Leptodontidium sp. 2 PMI_412]